MGNSFLMDRFGKLITTGDGQARAETFLAGLGHPIDVHVAAGKFWVLE